jgi:hypothetical protein
MCVVTVSESMAFGNLGIELMLDLLNAFNTAEEAVPGQSVQSELRDDRPVFVADVCFEMISEQVRTDDQWLCSWRSFVTNRRCAPAR